MTPPLTPEQVERLESLLSKATVMPWSVCGAQGGNCPCGFIWSGDGHIHLASVYDVHDLGKDWYGSDAAVTRQEAATNAALITEAVNALPALLSSLKASQERVRELEEEVETAYKEGWCDGQPCGIEYGQTGHSPSSVYRDWEDSGAKARLSAFRRENGKPLCSMCKGRGGPPSSACQYDHCPSCGKRAASLREDKGVEG